MSACGTISRFRSDPAPTLAPVVYPASCLADPLDVAPVEMPPLPPAVERPAGEPSARNWEQFYVWLDNRRERAELAGLYFQGMADAEAQANVNNTEQLRQCVTFIRGVQQ